MRDIKFRAWDGKNMYRVKGLRWILFGSPEEVKGIRVDDEGRNDWKTMDEPKLMQYTGLKDSKEKLAFIYEGDIINENGLIKGNIYENKEIFKEGIDIIVTEVCTKNWRDTEEELIKRGCSYA